MKIGILGFPQSGRKTLFSLLSGRNVSAIHKEGEAVEAVAWARDPRVDRIVEIVKPKRMKYAEIHLALCPDVGAEAGRRDWLEPARRCDLLCMVVRGFHSANVYHSKGSVDAKRDRADLETELLLADLELIEKRLERIGKEKRGGQTPAQIMEEKTLLKCRKAVEGNEPLSRLNLDPHERQSIGSLGLLTLIPVLWAFNVDETDVAAQPAETNAVAVSCLIERDIATIENSAERMEYLKELGVEASGLDRMMAAAYRAAGVVSFYTIANDEVRAWPVRCNTLAPAAGGKVHTDIERGFIRVEVIRFDDLVALGSEEAVKAHGKIRVKGKDYLIEDGDICYFRFSV